jgi:hypothetical protein
MQLALDNSRQEITQLLQSQILLQIIRINLSKKENSNVLPKLRNMAKSLNLLGKMKQMKSMPRKRRSNHLRNKNNHLFL